jgi:hypothetical protein
MVHAMSDTMTEAVSELCDVARLMRRYRLDSVEMPSGLKVLKTTHMPLAESPPSPEAVEDAVARRLEALGVVNATSESGRVPLEEDEVMFAASRAPAMPLEDFRPQPEQPVEGEESIDADE